MQPVLKVLKTELWDGKFYGEYKMSNIKKRLKYIIYCRNGQKVAQCLPTVQTRFSESRDGYLTKNETFCSFVI